MLIISAVMDQGRCINIVCRPVLLILPFILAKLRLKSLPGMAEAVSKTKILMRNPAIVIWLSGKLENKRLTWVLVFLPESGINLKSHNPRIWVCVPHNNSAHEGSTSDAPLSWRPREQPSAVSFLLQVGFFQLPYRCDYQPGKYGCLLRW